ncbi:MAG: PqqD family protein [Myxococcota bacterium]
MQAEEKLRDLAVSDSGFVFDPYTGATFSVNPAGQLLLKELKDGRDRAALVASLRESFEIRGEDVERDVDEFVALLKSNGVLPADFVL